MLIKRATFEELSDLAKRLGLEIILVDIPTEPAKYISYVLSKPIDIRAIINLYEGFVDRLEKRGLKIIGKRNQLGRSSEDWLI